MKKTTKDTIYKFCRFCGSTLIIEVIVNHYDRKTGQPIYLRVGTCPKVSFWSSWSHDEKISVD